ncbi:unnamed protein product [Effrenium voratum]|uniref:Uncharacterized protein n=1 Tax=Effrenium voratum TaxID=2562239 RepID=A0AA36N5L0_9DINO|nr:unnamed protein product [Effrenium voratum]CAJ1458671.1 unnamed protein product [Effrenium voratum]
MARAIAPLPVLPVPVPVPVVSSRRWRMLPCTAFKARAGSPGRATSFKADASATTVGASARARCHPKILGEWRAPRHSWTGVSVFWQYEGLECVVLQGSGPHFCPGGNVQAQIREGETAFGLAPFTGFVAQLRLRELGEESLGLLTVALQGLVQGGGLAMALVADWRLADQETSFSLGNLSRGAVPCILMSAVLAATPEAMALYLEDAVLDVWGALQLGLVQAAGPGAKLAAHQAARAGPARAARARAARARLDAERFAQEAFALQLSIACGEAFRGPRFAPEPARDIERDGGTEGRRDGGTEGRTDGGTEGRRDGGTGLRPARQ